MSNQNVIQLSNSRLDCMLSGARGLALERYGLAGGASWLNSRSTSEIFGVYLDGEKVTGQTEGLTLEGIDQAYTGDGATHYILRLGYDTDHVHIEYHSIAYPDSSLMEMWVSVRNNGSRTVRIDRLDTISIDVPSDIYELMYYTSGWGQEFGLVQERLEHDEILDTKKGRSSGDKHPWFALVRGDAELLSASAMWSGNWAFRFEELQQGGYRISGGLNDWEFFKDLAPGQSMDGAHIALVLGSGNNLNSVSTEYARVGRRYWYPQNELSQSLPVEWNHWWSYEDKNINETVFKANVDMAARMGVDICTLDAGWFGPTDLDTDWYDYRGDWDLVNTTRFPSGIRALSDYVHDKSMKFGLWCEIEALGQHARLASTHSDLVAMDSGELMGYVCFGSPAAQEWAYNTLDRLISEYNCDWIKLDFNLDPGPGCNRTDHGHGAGDGLYEHYLGYYNTLQRVRQRHPQVILENCSSGGLRIDLGMMRQTHLTFLSDPDWPEHDLQLFWGASTMLAPGVCLHWGWCEWVHEHPHQTFNPRDPNLTQHQLDYYTRISMLGAFGFSQKLPELLGWIEERFAYHIWIYKQYVREFVRNADIYRLTEQPAREMQGDRWAAFQYRMPSGDSHLIFVFRLPGAESERVLFPQQLEKDRVYNITGLGSERAQRLSGHELMTEGLRFSGLREEDSEIILVR